MEICQGVLIAGMCTANLMSWFLAERKTAICHATCCQLAGDDSFILFVPSFRLLVQWDPKRAREGSSAVSGIPLRLPYPILQDASVVH